MEVCGEGIAQHRGPLQQVESRDFKGVWAECPLGPRPLQTVMPHMRSLSVLPCTAGTRELSGSILGGRALPVWICESKALPPWPLYWICE